MAARSGDPRNTKRWQELRKQVLKEEPTCHYCGKKATTVDHVVELDQGGDPYERANLVGACQPCNSRKGQAYGERKRQHQRRTGDAFFSTQKDTPPDSFRRSLERPKTAASGRISPDRDLAGHIRPRIELARGGDRSHGPAVIRWAAENLNLQMFEWQQHVLEQQLAIDEDGYFVHTESLVSVARQNGKSTLLAALIGWWLTEHAATEGPQTVANFAQKLALSEDVFRILSPILDERYGGRSWHTSGRQMSELPDGSRWIVASANKTGAHGLSLDLAVVDELWTIGSEVIYGAITPTQIARPNPLLSMWSTAGDDHSEAMLHIRQRALTALELNERPALYFAEWSPPPDFDITDPAAWQHANPAMGRTITAPRLANNLQTMPRGEFVRAHCNMWVQSSSSWLEPGQWSSLETDTTPPPGGVLVIETSLDDSTVSGVVVVALDDERLHARHAFTVSSLADAWQHTAAHLEERNTQLAVTPGIAEFLPQDQKRRAVIVGQREAYRYTAHVLELIRHGRIVHPAGQTMFDEHVNRAVLVKSNSGVAIHGSKSNGPVELARALVWAAGLAAKPTRRPVPAMGRAR